MISPNRRQLRGFVLAAALLPTSAGAQTVARSFEELQGILKAEEIVIVIDKTGQATRGKVAEVSASSLVLVIPEKTSGGQELYTTAKRRTFAEDSVTEIVRSDPLGTKGARIYRSYLVPTRSFQDLQRILKVGQTVIVTDKSGQETKGKVGDVSPSSLVVSTRGSNRFASPEKRAFAEDIITEIRVTDPWWNGILIGAGIGASPWLLTVGEPEFPSVSDLVVFTTISIPVGAAIGAVVDAMRVGRTVYVSPRKTSGLTISPLLGKDRQGALVSVRF